MGIEIKRVKPESRQEMETFIRFPFRLYKDQPQWVPPILMDERETLNPGKNPAFDSAEAAYWMAFKDGEPAGRIAGILLEQELKDTRLARFGWFDFIDDDEVSRLLLETAELWALRKGAAGIHGPLGFTDMDSRGILTEGFEETGPMGAQFNFPYYCRHVLRNGYHGTAEWVEYKGDLDLELSDRDLRRSEFIKDRFGLEVLDARKQKDYLPHGDDMFRLINETYSDLYGYYSLSRKQINYYIDKYLKFVRTEYFIMILKEGKLVAFGIGMPSFSEALKANKGRMLPFGWWQMLKAFKQDDIIDLYLISADPEYANLGLVRLIMTEMYKNLKKNNAGMLKTNPILQTNKASKGMWSSPVVEDARFEIYRKRQCFRKDFQHDRK